VETVVSSVLRRNPKQQLDVVAIVSQLLRQLLWILQHPHHHKTTLKGGDDRGRPFLRFNRELGQRLGDRRRELISIP